MNTRTPVTPANFERHEDEALRDELQRRADVVVDACNVAFARAAYAWREGNQEARRLWIGVQDVCGSEIREIAACMCALEPA